MAKKVILVDEDLWQRIKVLRDEWGLKNVSDTVRRIMEVAGFV